MSRENLGKLADKYPNIGFTRKDVQKYRKVAKCRGCRESIGKIPKKRLITENYKRMKESGEGIDIDVLFVCEYTFLLVKSSSTKFNWAIPLKSGRMYNTMEIKEAIWSVITEYIFYDRPLKWLRTDADSRIHGVRKTAEMVGIKWIQAPAALKTVRAERAIRSLKDMARSLACSLLYTMPHEWIPLVIKEAANLINIRPRSKNNIKCPYEEFTGLIPELTNPDLWICFGRVISYPEKVGHKDLRARFNYGIVIGRVIETGNLIVENLLNRKRETINFYHEEHHLDDLLRAYFAGYSSSINGLDWKPGAHISVQDPENSSEGDRLSVMPLVDDNWDANNTSTMTANINVFDSMLCTDTTTCNIIPSPETVLSSNTGVTLESFLSTHEGLKDESVATERIHSPKWGDHQDCGNNLQISLSDYNNLDVINITNDCVVNVLQYNYRDMYKKHPDATLASAKAELKGIIDRGTLEPIHKSEIQSNTKVIYIMTKYVEKFKLGTLDKIKSRLLLGGNKLADEFTHRWDEVNAHTISQSSLFFLAGLYAKQKFYTGTIDFSQAFLYADLPAKDHCIAKVPKDESKLMIQLDNSYSKYLNADGHIYAKVVKALYGHPLPPKLWYDHLVVKLALIGFKPLETDNCVFMRKQEDKLSLIGLHVDDGFIGSEDENVFEELRQWQKEYFRGEGTIEVGDLLEYLNLMFRFNKPDGSVKISQEPYWDKVIARFNCMTKRDKPHTTAYMKRLYNRDEDVKGSDKEITEFLSLIMSIMWGAKRSQQCVLFNTTSLASQCKYGTKEDYEDAMHLLAYISNNKSEYVKIKIDGEIQLSAFVDSSANLYKDTRGHGGYIISCGNTYCGPVPDLNLMDVVLWNMNYMLSIIYYLTYYS